jgi:hypothetical protein
VEPCGGKVACMGHVIVRFVKKPPERVRLKGEWWRIRYVREGKNGKVATLFAVCETDGREIVFVTGRERAVLHEVSCGFHVRGGTPARGFVTELRRIGLVELSRW